MVGQLALPCTHRAVVRRAVGCRAVVFTAGAIVRGSRITRARPHARIRPAIEATIRTSVHPAVYTGSCRRQSTRVDCANGDMRCRRRWRRARHHCAVPHRCGWGREMAASGSCAIKARARRLQADAIGYLRTAKGRFVDADRAAVNHLPVHERIARDSRYRTRIMRVGVIEVGVVNVDVVDVGCFDDENNNYY